MKNCVRPCLLLGIAAIVTGSLGCASRRVQATPVAPAPVPEVLYATVRATRSPTVVELPGIVTAVRSVTLRAPVAGEVQTVAEDGSRLPVGGVAALLAVALIFSLGVQPPNDAALWITAAFLAITAAVWFGFERRRFQGPPMGDAVANTLPVPFTRKVARSRPDDTSHNLTVRSTHAETTTEPSLKNSRCFRSSP